MCVWGLITVLKLLTLKVINFVILIVDFLTNNCKKSNNETRCTISSYAGYTSILSIFRKWKDTLKAISYECCLLGVEKSATQSQIDFGNSVSFNTSKLSIHLLSSVASKQTLRTNDTLNCLSTGISSIVYLKKHRGIHSAYILEFSFVKLNQ